MMTAKPEPDSLEMALKLLAPLSDELWEEIELGENDLPTTVQGEKLARIAGTIEAAERRLESLRGAEPKGGELKACPFCGGKASDEDEGLVLCIGCGARCDDAETWNRREPKAET